MHTTMRIICVPALPGSNYNAMTTRDHHNISHLMCYSAHALSSAVIECITLYNPAASTVRHTE